MNHPVQHLKMYGVQNFRKFSFCYWNAEELGLVDRQNIHMHAHFKGKSFLIDVQSDFCSKEKWSKQLKLKKASRHYFEAL